MMDFDPLALIVGYAFGIVTTLVLVVMMNAAQPDPNEEEPDEYF